MTCIGAAAELDPARDSHASQLTEEQLVQKLPEQVQQQFLDGELPISLHSLKVSSLMQIKVFSLLRRDEHLCCSALWHSLLCFLAKLAHTLYW